MQNSVGQNQIPQNMQTMYQKPVQHQVVQQNAPQIAPVQQTYVAPQPPVVQSSAYQTPYNYQTPPQQQSVQVPNYSGVNIQIFNPSVTPPGATPPVYNVNAPSYQMGGQGQSYPANYYTQQFNPNQGLNSAHNATTTTTTTNTTVEPKKTEKRKVVQLTDDYIRNLENYLNSQDKELRFMGAKEVVARLEEDESRKDDKALNALINKMLQDPYQKVRFLAMAALQSKMASGDPLTVQLLTNIQNSPSGYGQDSLLASDILLKMAGQTVEKEFEVKTQPKDKK